MRRVIICGTRFGQFYIEAIRLLPDVEIVGILAKGSERSKKCSEYYNIPLIIRLDDVPEDVEFACVAVKSEVLGGSGTNLALELMKKGIHVLFEQPIHLKEVTECFKAAQNYNVKFKVANLYINLIAIENFIENVRVISQKEKPLFINIDFATQVSYPLVQLLEEIFPDFRIGKVFGDVIQATPFQMLCTMINGVEVTFRAHNEVDKLEPDGFLHLFFQITVGYSGGKLILLDPHGPVIWQPRVHFPKTELIPANLLKNSLASMRELNIYHLYFDKTITQKMIFTQVWPEAIKKDILNFLYLISDEDVVAERKRVQKQLFLCQQWNQLMNKFGYPQIVEKSKYSYLNNKKLKHYGIIGKEVDEGVKYLNRACFYTMLFYLQKKFTVIEQFEKYEIDNLLNQMEVVDGYKKIIIRWLKMLNEEHYVILRGNSCYFELPKIIERDMLNSWDEAYSKWNIRLGTDNVFQYFRENAMRLDEIMTGNLNPALLLFPEGKFELATDLYSKTAIAKSLNSKIASEVVQKTNKNSNILEIGAGTGATTEVVCRELFKCNGCKSYIFSDLSDFFLYNAQEKFRKYAWMSYKKINIDESIKHLLDEKVDVVIAVGVLNNAKNIEASLKHIWDVLESNGYLYLIEAIGESAPMLISQAFMMKNADDSREVENVTFLNLDQWFEIFKESGFRLLRKEPDRLSELFAFNQSLFILQKKEEYYV